MLVGWSYGSFVICDYVRAHGQERIAAINFVEGAVKLGEAAFGTLIGPGLLDHFAGATADDLPTNIWAMRSFVKTCLVKPLPADDIEAAICWNIVVPPQIRANLAAREIDDDDVLRDLEVPLLVTQGRADVVVLPAMAEHVLTTCPTAEASWYEGVGHAPHLEEPERFNRELAALTRGGARYDRRRLRGRRPVPAARLITTLPGALTSSRDSTELPGHDVIDEFCDVGPQSGTSCRTERPEWRERRSGTSLRAPAVSTNDVPP